MPIDRGNVRGLVRAIAYDLRGSRLGRVAQVFIDDRTDEPAWVAVDVTRTRGMRLLPLAGAGLKGRHLVIRAERSTVRSAPRIDLGDGQLSSQDESRLLEHYGLAPANTGGMHQTAEQRPASPWPDDTERETAWEQPAQPSYVGHDTRAISPGWEQPTVDKPAPEQLNTDPPTATEQAAATSRAERPATQNPAVEQPAAEQPVAEQPTQGSGEIGARGVTRDRGIAAEGSGPGAAPAVTRDTAPTPVTPAPSPPLGVATKAPSPTAHRSTAAGPSDGSGSTPPHPDPDPQGSSPAPPTR